MIPKNNDPLGKAIEDFSATNKSEDIIVQSDICDDDIIPSSYLLRSYSEMPELEQIALKNCVGKVLDVGAGAGIHAKYLMDMGMTVEAIDVSEGAVRHMVANGINARVENFFQTKSIVEYDTILMLMNGIGIAGELKNLAATLLHAKQLLSSKGKIICDSTDIKYLYEDEEGGVWMDFNSEYYGNFNFQMHYKDQKTEWFKWLYVDFENLEKEGAKLGFTVRKLAEFEDQYLAELELKE